MGEEMYRQTADPLEHIALAYRLMVEEELAPHLKGKKLPEKEGLHRIGEAKDLEGLLSKQYK